MLKLRNINAPGVRRVRALHELLELVDRWQCLETRDMEGCVVSMNKCETMGCPAQCHSSPFCPACLTELKASLEAAGLNAARTLMNEGIKRRKARKLIVDGAFLSESKIETHGVL